MQKQEALAHIEQNLESGEELIGYFMAQSTSWKWLIFLIGPLAFLTLRVYFVGVSNRGIHFHQINFMGNKFIQHDKFRYEEIEKAKIGWGFLQLPIKFFFKNERKFKINAQLKGVERVAKIDEATLDFLKSRLTIV